MSQLTERPRVLIAEDDVGVRKFLCTVMQEYGLEPLEAPDGEVALQLLETNPIDLLLLDIELPGMNGLEVLRHAKQRDKGLPVIVITGQTSISAAIDAIRAGAENYLAKPVSPKNLISILATPLRTRLAWRAQLAVLNAKESSGEHDNDRLVRCPCCKFGAVRPSHLRGFEALLLVVLLRPYRCSGCERRFWYSPVKRWLDISRFGFFYWIFDHRWRRG